ncbi:MAG: bacterial Ig-like domain-containing protein [Acholeplasmatales bacterium]|nr:bacterial Ig-like domain-containing protein [Acholeplasmatales bacterium]
MKGLKTISIALLSLSMVLAFSSCRNHNSVDRNRDIVADYSGEQYANLTENEIGAKYNDALSSVSVDTSEARTTFYVGEKFDSEGIKVIKVIRRRNLETSAVEVIEQESSEYTINTDEVDMNKIGTYPVTVTVRVGVATQTDTYYINVCSSLFETTPNLDYTASVKARYKSDGKSIREYIMGVDEIKEIKASDISLELVNNSVDANLDISQTFTPLSLDDSKLEIDFSKVDYTKEGSYVIRITYKAGTVTIDGVDYDNTVTSFVCVSITNPIKEIEIAESNDTFEFNVEYSSIDYFTNSGWKIKATHTNGDEEILNITSDLFSISNMKTLYWDNAQVVTINLTGTDKKIDTTIIIVNEGATAKVFNDLKSMDSDAEGAYVEGLGYKIIIDTEGIIYGPSPAAGNATYTTGRSSKDSYDGLSFETRVTIKGDKQFFSVKVDNASESQPTAIVVYFASSSAEVRELTFIDPEGEETVFESTSTKQEICRAILYAKENGVYKFYSSSSMYIHGIMVVGAKK